jgi:histidinol-phosphate aminotransferase
MGSHDGVTHGALDHAELAALGLRAEDLLDFSSNLNPFGPPPQVRAALAELDPAPYPDRSCHRLKLVLAARHACDPAAILPGNGANELIYLAARALLTPGDQALVVAPTYGEYAYASRLSGADVVDLRAYEPVAGQFAFDADMLIAAIRRTQPRLTWLCAPNNPTGTDPTRMQIERLAEACALHNGLLIIDRSYVGLRRTEGPHRLTSIAGVPHLRRQSADHPNLIELYSFTKSYAIAGLRLGYLLAAPEIAARIGAFQPAWSVSSVAQVAGLTALESGDFLETTIGRLWLAGDQLQAALRNLGLDVRRDSLPFMLVQTGDGSATRTALLQHGCVVRDCTSFGLAGWVRVAPQRPEVNMRLLAAWKAIL